VEVVSSLNRQNQNLQPRKRMSLWKWMRMRRLAKLKTACVRSAAVETIVIGERPSLQVREIQGTATIAVEIDVTMATETAGMAMVVDMAVVVEDTIEDRHRQDMEGGEGVE
jgi:hypothetical protein